MAKLEEPPSAPSTEEDQAEETQAAVPPALVANTVGEYLRASLARIKGGDTGILPVVAGLILVSILFQAMNDRFLTAGNLVNLLVQSAVFSLHPIREIYA
jgi:D-xylose transport system permease protein